MEVVINYWAVLGAAVAAFVVGMLWYGPLFGKMWMGLTGITMESMKSMPLKPVPAMALGFVGSLLTAYVLAHSYAFASAFMNAEGASVGLMAGFWNWLGFAFPITAGVFLWEGKPVKLWLLNAAYYLAVFLAMGAIIGYFG